VAGIGYGSGYGSGFGGGGGGIDDLFGGLGWNETPQQRAEREQKEQKEQKEREQRERAAREQARKDSLEQVKREREEREQARKDSLEQVKREKATKDSLEQIALAKKRARGTFTDTRDGKKYKTIVIGKQKWLAQNLNYDDGKGGSKCYDNERENCANYGRLYTWDAAMKACPAGWHVPRNYEWERLVNNVGGELVAGEKLKAASGAAAGMKTGGDPRRRVTAMGVMGIVPGQIKGKSVAKSSVWGLDDNNDTDDDEDEYGFSALFGGYGSWWGGFYNGDWTGHWWSAPAVGDAYYMYSHREDVDRHSDGKTYLYSVRCGQDGF
jgi:hypothetical protein